MNQREQESEQKILQKMQATPTFRFQDLWMPFGGGSCPEYRQADKLIQRERRAGRIRMVKHGVWEVVR